ncbi:nucleotidyltransferase family protein [Candidatus Peregrinibacteria bacterium]|nr:nucleotidyltransferase family protein [Candidatus Peregrinibacteria bacterium]
MGKKMRTSTIRIANKYGAKHVRVFGSFARGEQTKKSDVDLLVRMPKGTTLFDLAGLKIDLEKELRRKVDIVQDHCVKPSLRSSILSEARSL